MADYAQIVEGPWNEDCDLPTLIEQGDYEAVYVRHFFIAAFKKPRLVMTFRITQPGAAFGVLLDCFWVVNKTGKRRWSPNKYSKLAKDVARLFPWFRRPCKHIQGAISDLFQKKLFLVRVVPVEKDHEQRDQDFCYSKIETVVKILQGD